MQKKKEKMQSSYFPLANCWNIQPSFHKQLDTIQAFVILSPFKKKQELRSSDTASVDGNIYFICKLYHKLALLNLSNNEL